MKNGGKMKRKKFITFGFAYEGVWHIVALKSNIDVEEGGARSHTNPFCWRRQDQRGKLRIIQ